jgi:hypothetical protein
MATSRYSNPTVTGGNVSSSGNSSTSGSQTGTSSTTGQSSTSGSSVTQTDNNSTTNTQNMTGSSLAALETLIQQMLGGGTPEMARLASERQQQINRSTQQQQGYSRENAFADAQGLMAQTMRQTLEKLVPGINRAAAGSGTSQGSMRALLLQQAAENAAQNASAAGLGAAVNYGQVANGAGNTVASILGQQNDAATQALLQALGIARGAVTSSTSTGSQTSTTNSDSNTNSSSNTNTSQNSNSNTNTNQQQSSGSGTAAPTNTNNDGLVYYGPQTTTQGMMAPSTGSTLDTLLQLANDTGGNNSWSNSFSF